MNARQQAIKSMNMAVSQGYAEFVMIDGVKSIRITDKGRARVGKQS